MNTKLYLQSLENVVSQENDMTNVYFTEYYSPSPEKPNRDGVFFSLFNKMIEPRSEKIPHIILSRFELFNDQTEFFRINNYNQFHLDEKSTYVILFRLDPREAPLELLNDFLKWFQDEHLFKLKNAKLLAHYNYNLDMANPTDQKYLLSYFQLIEKHLGKIPELLSHVDFEKKASFENCLIIEAGTQWSCLDNYLVHVALSKGGHLLQSELDITRFQILSEQPLSPHHSMQKIRKLQLNAFDISCPFLEDLREKNFFKHPEELKLFYYLIYNNIFNEQAINNKK